MSPVGIEPTISAGEGPQTYTLDRAAVGTAIQYIYTLNNLNTAKDSQLKSTTRTNCCIYTVYLLMIGRKYVRNMQRLTDEIN
jgi:hypothetical protein